MAVTRRSILKTGLASGAVLSLPSVLKAQSTPPAAKTLKAVKAGDLRVFDPIWTTANITGDHGAMIYDTLFALDSTFTPQPQMVGKWRASDDRKTYTFELRDGLGWHDGTPVTSADCVESIWRWGQNDPAGQAILARSGDIAKRDDETFVVTLKEPFPLLIDVMAKLSTPNLFIMREKDAKRPASEQVTANIGSGPFIFNQSLAKPGVSFTYDRNPKYVPRSEVPDGLAGAKVAKLERIIWENISDAQTAMSALQAGEVDYLERPPMDLLPVLESDPNIVVEILNKGGDDCYIRMNFLQKPFDNVKARQALLHLVDQQAFMAAAFGDEKYFRPLKSLFGSSTLASNDENTGWYRPGGNPEKAKELFKEAGYAGEKVVILQPTNSPWQDNASQFLAATLRKIGVNAELAPSDWGGVVTRRAKKDPVDQGGWSVFISLDSDYSHGDPVGTPFLLASGEKAWYGWPKNDEYEALRKQWLNTTSVDERKALAGKMQGLWWDFVGAINLGRRFSPVAYRKNVSGWIGMPEVIPMWNVQKV